jgi:uncharacterized membrane protein YcaP (DUF421 family)
MLNLGVPWWELVLRPAVIYIALLAGLRIFGKREVGQFTLFDLVFILLVANAVQPAMTGPDSSLLGGVIIIATLLAANLSVAFLDRMPFFHRLTTPAPTVIVKDGMCLTGAMLRESVLESDVEMAMREHGLDKLSDVKLAVLEADGSISIVPEGSVVHKSRHRVRFVRPGTG